MSNAAERGIADGTYQCPAKLQSFVRNWVNKTRKEGGIGPNALPSSATTAAASHKHNDDVHKHNDDVRKHKSKSTATQRPQQQHHHVEAATMSRRVLPSPLEMVFDTTGKYKYNAAAASTSATQPKGTAILYHSKVTRHRRHAAQSDYDALATVFAQRRVVMDRVIEELTRLLLVKKGEGCEGGKVVGGASSSSAAASLVGGGFPHLAALFANDGSLFEQQQRYQQQQCSSASALSSSSSSSPQQQQQRQQQKSLCITADFTVHQQLINTILSAFQKAKATILSHQEAAIRRCIRAIDGADAECERPERVERTWEHLLAMGLPQHCALKCFAPEEDAAVELELVTGSGGAPKSAELPNTSGALAPSFKLAPAKTKVLQLVHDRDHIDMVDDYSIQLERARMRRAGEVEAILSNGRRRVKDLLGCDADEAAGWVSDFLFRRVLVPNNNNGTNTTNNAQYASDFSPYQPPAGFPSVPTAAAAASTPSPLSPLFLKSLKSASIEALRSEFEDFFQLVLLEAAEHIAGTNSSPSATGFHDHHNNGDYSLSEIAEGVRTHLNSSSGALCPDVQPFAISVGQDLYACKHTAQAARLACGGVVHLALEVCKPDSALEAAVDAMGDDADEADANGAKKKKKCNSNNLGVIDGSPSDLRTVHNGFALVRPPGHHSGAESASGFCFFNNVAVAARAAQKQFPNRIKKVLIIDWDVHHGDGTEAIFANDPTVMCFSVHQFGAKLGHVVRKRSSVAAALAKRKAEERAAAIRAAKKSNVNDGDNDESNLSSSTAVIRDEMQRIVSDAVMTRHLLSPPMTPEGGGGRPLVDPTTTSVAASGVNDVTSLIRRKGKALNNENGTSAATTMTTTIGSKRPREEMGEEENKKGAFAADLSSVPPLPELSEEDVLNAMMDMEFDMEEDGGEEKATVEGGEEAKKEEIVEETTAAAPDPIAVKSEDEKKSKIAPADASRASVPPAIPFNPGVGGGSRRTRNKEHLLASIRETIAAEEEKEKEKTAKNNNEKKEGATKHDGEGKKLAETCTIPPPPPPAATTTSATSLAEEMAAIGASGRRTRPKALFNAHDDHAATTTDNKAKDLSGEEIKTATARPADKDNDADKDALLLASYFETAANNADDEKKEGAASSSSSSSNSASRSDMATTTDGEDDDDSSSGSDDNSDTTSSEDEGDSSNDSFLLAAAAAAVEKDLGNNKKNARGEDSTDSYDDNANGGEEDEDEDDEPQLTRYVIKDKREPHRLNNVNNNNNLANNFHSGWVSNTEDFDDVHYQNASRTHGTNLRGGGGAKRNRNNNNASSASLTTEAIMAKHNGNINFHIFDGDASGKGSNASFEDDAITFNNSPRPSLSSVPTSLFDTEDDVDYDDDDDDDEDQRDDNARDNDNAAKGKCEKRPRVSKKYKHRLPTIDALVPPAGSTAAVGGGDLLTEFALPTMEKGAANTEAPTTTTTSPAEEASPLAAAAASINNIHRAFTRFANPKPQVKEAFYPGTGKLDEVGNEAPSGRWLKIEKKTKKKTSKKEATAVAKENRTTLNAETDNVSSVDDNASDASSLCPSDDDDDEEEDRFTSAAGRTVNAPWPCHGFGDIEYLQLFHSLLLPMIDEFAPDLILVACGFDSAKEDNLGAMQMTPSGYYYLTRLLMKSFEARRHRWEEEEAGKKKTMSTNTQTTTTSTTQTSSPHFLPPVPRLVVALEGGYNLQNVALGSEAVLRALMEESADGATLEAMARQREAFEAWVGKRFAYKEKLLKIRNQVMKQRSAAAMATATAGSKQKGSAMGSSSAAAAAAANNEEGDLLLLSPPPIAANGGNADADIAEASFLPLTKEHLTEENHPDRNDPCRARVLKKRRVEEALKAEGLLPPAPPLPLTGVPPDAYRRLCRQYGVSGNSNPSLSLSLPHSSSPASPPPPPHVARNRMLAHQCKTLISKVQAAHKPYWRHLSKKE